LGLTKMMRGLTTAVRDRPSQEKETEKEKVVYPVTVSIRGDLLNAESGLDPVGLIDILWAHARPEDGLEHIAQHVNEDAVDITLFVKSDALESAYRAAIRICRSALCAARPLADWKMITDDQVSGSIRIS
jgi:hypothetical protein